MTEKVKKAMEFCIKAHSSVGQIRKYTGQPYYVHPFEVMAIVQTVTEDEDMLCAALLHDTVEDTPVTLEQIRAEFGPNVASLVDQLTDVSKPEDGNREKRKSIDRIHTSLASADAKTIKLADLISNTRTITVYDPDFAVVYMKEKAELLPCLTNGNVELWNIANKMVSDFHKNLPLNSFFRQVKRKNDKNVEDYEVNSIKQD